MNTRPDTLYSKLFARVYDPLLHNFEERYLQSRRQELISHLEGRILEVGSGTGVNLPLYTEKASVIVLEPSPAMMEQARKRLQKERTRGEFTLVEGGVEDPHLEQLIPAGSLDGIVSTLVLCTVPHPEEAIRSFRRWLKKGGELVVLEHIRSHHSMTAKLQDMAAPLWKRMAEGCHLNRHTDRLLKEGGFKLLEEEYFSKGFPFYQARFRLS